MTRLAFDGGWSLELPDRFRRIERDGGLDATDGYRTVHLSALSLQPGIALDRSPSAKELHQSRRPTRSAYELAGPIDWGWAVIESDQEGPHLRGTREADGTILTCWITYPDDAQAGWAVDVWRSVQSSLVSKTSESRSD